MQLHDDETVDVLRVLDLLRGGKPGFLEDPVITAFFVPLLRPQEVPTPEQGDPERPFDLVEITVGREGSIRDEDRVRLPKAVLYFLAQDLLELREHNRLVDHPSDGAAFLVPQGPEISDVRS